MVEILEKISGGETKEEVGENSTKHKPTMCSPISLPTGITLALLVTQAGIIWKLLPSHNLGNWEFVPSFPLWPFILGNSGLEIWYTSSHGVLVHVVR